MSEPYSRSTIVDLAVPLPSQIARKSDAGRQVMSDSSAAARWLMHEAVDHLAEDYVGIYELLWLLRGSDFELDDTAAKQLARQTADQLVSIGAASIIRLRWPSNEVVPGEIHEISPDDDTIFEPAEAGVYLALASTVDAR
ncbi:hypothetical protein [Nocardia sp. NPDC050793]|uniref:hypothetical protein n=1 Tax=Nocardia sp. NPDC050793 TaxID=3155159 RepID=UPI0033CED5C8